MPETALQYKVGSHLKQPCEADRVLDLYISVDDRVNTKVMGTAQALAPCCDKPQ